MRSIHIVGLVVILLITACGQPADLPLSAPAAEAPSATSKSASIASQTAVTDAQPVPCPTVPVYPPPALGETLTPAKTPTATSTPVPTPTIDPDAVPVEPAPAGLGTITLPKDAATLRGIFATMPEQIGNHRRGVQDYTSAYNLYVRYQDLESTAALPQVSLSLDADGTLGEGLFPNKIGITDADPWRRDGQVFYAYDDQQFFEPLNDQNQNCRESTFVTLTFVVGECPWLFSAQARTREDIELLVAAFVATVNASPAPIPYVEPTPWETPRPGTGYPVTGSYPPPQDGAAQQMPTTTPTTTATP